ncbi:hypothetical protein QC762_206810 [Podospora pseudocomata]|uniref:Uncharacterized protein n=1 Tax=Podospora pseudocomata TaxID=2093779 RepID=A0ABR0GLW2_9PEZI|nr:hypothetical protein QC762_206810 [Podospora pseudocomata]
MVSVTFFATILSMGLAVLAAPANFNNTSVVEARDSCDSTKSFCPKGDRGQCNPGVDGCMHIYYCEHIWSQGDCAHSYSWTGECHNIPAKFDNAISSIANENVDQSDCHWFDGADCTGAQYSNENDQNLADGNGWWNDRISSYRCDYHGPAS